METADMNGLRQRPVVSEEKPHASESTPKVSNQGWQHPGGAAHGPFMQATRIVALVVYFLGCCISMHFGQLVGAHMYWYDREWYYAWMALSKQNFGLLTVTMQQWWSPTVVRVSGDKSVRGQLRRTEDGRLESDFPERMLLIANHEIYTDWLYLWWMAYTARMHGHIFIILKESLKWIPILGPGMQLFSFIFMSRNWTTDKDRMAYRMKKLKRRREGEPHYNPMWMLIFPEGTNHSVNGRAKSAAWAKKQGIPDLQHTLLPRSTGLHFCLEELGDTIEWMYDCTLAYEGIPRGQYGQDIYTLRGIYLEGRAPKSVNMYWRRFAVKDIPKDPKEFEAWTLERWREKDGFLGYYMQNGRFPADEIIDTTVRPRHPLEFLQIFAPLAALVMVFILLRRSWNWLLIALYIRTK